MEKCVIAYHDDTIVSSTAAAITSHARLAQTSIAQTTMLQADYVDLVEVLKTKADLYEDRGRICGWTLHAQDEAVELAKSVDACVVVGGRDSSNTIQLVRVCEPHAPTFHVETAEELRADWFTGMSRVGLLAGASTREVDIQAVTDFLSALNEAADVREPALV